MPSYLQPVPNVADLRDSLIGLPHHLRRLWNWRPFLSRDSLIESRSSIPTLPIDIHDLLHPRHRLREDGSHSIHPPTRRNQAERETHSVLLRGQQLHRQLPLHTFALGTMQPREQDLESQYCGNLLWQGSVYGLCIFSGNFWSKFRYCACAVSCSYALASASQAPYQARFDSLVWVWYCVSLSEMLVNIY